MNKNTKIILWIAGGLAVVALVGFLVVQMMRTNSLAREVEEARQANEELQLANEQLALSNEFETVSAEFEQYEMAAQKLTNDTVYAKYTAAKNKIEKLMNELKSLKNDKAKSKARIAELQSQISSLRDEISTLRNLLRHYVAQVDSLNKVNNNLQVENREVKTRNEELTARVEETSRSNEQLTQRMTLAEKLNVTGVSLRALKKNGKEEKNVTKATQLMVTFTIPQNNSTPVGNKTIYMRLTNPEGQLLGGGGSFSFEGRSLSATGHKTVEYGGDEISGIKMYWDVNTTLTPGDYTVELFTDGYRLASRHFTLTK